MLQRSRNRGKAAALAAPRNSRRDIPAISVTTRSWRATRCSSTPPPRGWRLDPGPGRAVRFQDSLEGNLGSLSRKPDRGRGTFEEAQDHLVLRHQHRPEVANALPVTGHPGNAGLHPPIERAQLVRLDPDPKTLRDEARRRLRHATNAMAASGRAESGVSLRLWRSLPLVHHPADLRPRASARLCV